MRVNHAARHIGCAILLASITPALHAQSLNGASIRLQTAETAVFLGDSVVVDVQSIGLVEPLDPAPLLIDADLLRETIGTRIAVVAGKVVEVRTRHMELLPRAEGMARFGPLRGESANGTVSSNHLQVSVQAPIDSDWQPDEEDVRLALTVSRTDPYVHEQVVVDLHLHHRHAIADERIVLPDFDGLDVLPVYRARRTLVDVDASASDGAGEGAWRRIAWRWLVWPSRSGDIELSPARWQGTMIRSRTARGDFSRSSAPIRLRVAPAPLASEDWWLPARNLQLSDAWSQEPNTLSAGDQIVRTLTLTADNVLASQLPDVQPLASRSLSSESLGVTREQTLIGDRISARAEYRFRLTARSPVPVFLDTVRVPWWDTAARRGREAIVPARRVNISLPDRADLLADAARGAGFHARWAQRLTALATRVPMSDAIASSLAVVLGIGLAGTTIAPWATSRLRRRRRGARHPLSGTARSAPSLDDMLPPQ